MFAAIARNLSANWQRLLVADLIFKALTVILLAPAVSLLFRIFLQASGRNVLADADIAHFLLHPLGWITLVIVGGAVLSIFALEQAVLTTICLGTHQHRDYRPSAAIGFVMWHALNVLRLTSHIVARLALIAIPFVAAGGALFAWLLTDHDINYYLTTKPPRFWWTVTAIAVILLVMSYCLLQRICSWIVALPLLLFEGIPPTACLRESHRRTLGQRSFISRAVGVWIGCNFLLSGLITWAILQAGEQLVHLSSGGKLWLFALTVGIVLGLLSLGNLFVNVLGNASCASLLTMLYVLRGGGRNALPMNGPGDEPASLDNPAGWYSRYRLSRPRLAAILLIGSLLALLAGATLLQSLSLEDEVDITAHRGGAGVAPENTLAAFRQAIQDQADWIEIDVQESSDGVVMVAHDSDLMKVARKPLKIWQTSAEELRQIDIGSYFAPEYAGERMPTLEEVLELSQGKIGVNIELKYYGHTQNLEQRAIELVEKYSMQEQVVFMSLEAAGIAKIKRLRPSWTCGLLTAVSAGDLTRARADFLAVNSSLATRQFINAAHARAKSVGVWTVNDPKTMSTMFSRNVDNLITDYPAIARQVLQERGQWTPLERLSVELAEYLGMPPPNGKL